jgi:hypothetical protein
MQPSATHKPLQYSARQIWLIESNSNKVIALQMSQPSSLVESLLVLRTSKQDKALLQGDQKLKIKWVKSLASVLQLSPGVKARLNSCRSSDNGAYSDSPAAARGQLGSPVPESLLNLYHLSPYVRPMTFRDSTTTVAIGAPDNIHPFPCGPYILRVTVLFIAQSPIQHSDVCVVHSVHQESTLLMAT